ncbi:aldehyde dehydrogenase family protein [Streptomyces apricus]|uniref:aldehyde dehydrogenase family protein n=1 Tax=Streptomyces apricus TaxID=1828112 RepID=UPI001F25F612|nr:aldehyde dehydrogenase family protein [Streptomyces apricus]
MSDDQRLFIGGSWVEPDGGHYEVIDPATEEVVGAAPEASREQVHAAAAAAREAFRSWSRTSPEERAAVLGRAADAIRRDLVAHAELAQAETGATTATARGMQVGVGAARFRRYARVEPVEEPLPPQVNEAGPFGGAAVLGALAVRRPVGVVTCITSYNNPWANPAGKIAPALATGNTVVVKPAPQDPLSVYRMAGALEAAGVPPGVVNDPTPVHTLPLLGHPHQQAPHPQQNPWAPPPTQPTGRGEGPDRRRRARLVTAVATAGALLLAGATWTALEAGNRLGDRGKSPSSASGPSASSRSTGRASGTETDADTDAEAETGGTAGAGGRTSQDVDPLATASDRPRPEAHAQQWLDAKTSLSFKEPISREDRKGDIRFNCKDPSCELESDTSLLVMMFAEPGTTLDMCRLILSGAEKNKSRHRVLPLAAAAAGTEICVKHSSGDIALLVVQVKSTALPDIAFLTLDMTIWREGS